MTDRPIIFSAAMVRALLDGRKTQTRRLATSPLRRCEPGDRLWVRESVGFWSDGHDCEIHFDNGATYATGPNTGDIPEASLVSYFRFVDKAAKATDRTIGIPSIHMPRWSSRLTLIVEAVRVEPLQAIKEADCLAEGPRVKGYAEFGNAMRGRPSSLDGVMVHTDAEHVFATPRCWYRELWDSLHGAGSWDANPEVVAISFSVVRGNIGRSEG
jgi:hypothetical protein